MQQTEQSKTDWQKFREFEAKKHQEFFKPAYDRLGMQIVWDQASATRAYPYDVIVEQEGQRLTIDEKARDREYGDFLVEVMQCLKTGKLGWIYHKVDKIF